MTFPNSFAFSFNPHPRRGAGAAVYARARGRVSTVSILTRAEARVLLEQAGFIFAGRVVSILTRAEARVLPSASNAMNCNV